MDSVNHPAHYNQGKIEVIEFIEDKDLGFHLGNAIKYISRAGHKDPGKIVEDLEKAIWYIRRFIEIKKASLEKREPQRPNDMKVDKKTFTERYFIAQSDNTLAAVSPDRVHCYNPANILTLQEMK